MNARERFIKSLSFQKPDKYILDPGYPRQSTLSRWYKEGLPQGMDYLEYVFDILGLDIKDRNPNVGLNANCKMMPEFEEKIIERKPDSIICQDWSGNVVEISDEYDPSYIREARDFVTRRWIKVPVENREDWEAMKTRYQVDTPGRFPDDIAEIVSRYEGSEIVCSFSIPGPFWQMRDWLGFESLCIAMINQPDLVMEMSLFWGDFIRGLLQVIHSHGIRIDFFMISEDMAYKAHSMISPEMVRRFLFPAYEMWTDELNNNGNPIISLDSDGYVGELIPLWIEAGFHCTSPCEVAAHNDVVEYRNLYGDRMAFMGSIDKRAIAAGGEVLEKEVERVVPPLLEIGGFIPQCDHGVPPDISLKNYVEFTRLLAQHLGWF